MRTEVKAITIALSIGLCGIGAALWQTSSSPTASQPPSDRRSPAASAPQLPPASEPLLAPSLGDAFAFERRIHVRLGTNELADLKIQGKLWARKSGESRFEIALQVEQPSEARSASWFRVTLDEAQQIGTIESGERSSLKSRLSPELTRLGEDLITQYFFFQKRDLQGVFEAEISKPAPNEVRKHKIRYTQLPYSKGTLTGSLHTLQLDDSGTPLRIQGEETLTLGESGQAIESFSSYEIRRDPSPSGSPWALLSATDWSWAALPLLDATHLQDVEGASWASLSGVAPLPELLAILNGGHLTTTQERLGLFRRLVKRMNAEPSQVGLATQALEELKARPSEFQILVGALAGTSLPEAHQALAKSYSDPTATPETKNLILNAWIASDAPLPSNAQAFVKRIASDPTASPGQRQGAWLALGAQASKAGEASPDRAEIEGLLVERLKSAQPGSERVAALEAVGNAGSRGLLPYLRDYLSDPLETVRAKAFLALRRIPGPDVVALITTGRSDPSRQVRRSVEVALNMRDSALD